jgi:hypothetical protein
VKVLFVKEYTAKTTGGESRSVAVGSVLDLSPEKAIRLITAGVAVDLDAIITCWRDFVRAADSVYRTCPKTADVWQQHQKHCAAAEAFFVSGCMAEAQSELAKAIDALKGTPLTQLSLAG